MTTNTIGYLIPSSFQMIQDINNEQPKMLQVHQDEFNRINKLKNLSKPYKNYLEMIYIKYICNKNKTKPTVVLQQPQHIGMKILNNLKT
jgi:3-polyprenyl-4-hydroxybenzoate decarboxylase